MGFVSGGNERMKDKKGSMDIQCSTNHKLKKERKNTTGEYTDTMKPEIKNQKIVFGDR
jgi:hypothetical protein